jgi:ribosomal protein S18 acetylase RimI-like enzyme
MRDEAPIVVRLAARADVGTLVDLMREFYAEANYPLDQGWAETSFSQLLEHAELGCVWLAECRGVVAGHAVLTVRYTMEHGALSGYIDDLFVKPKFRRQGVARALLSELFAECRRRRCKSMYVEVGERNVPAIELYRHFGLGPFHDGRVLLHGALPVVAVADAQRRS